MSVYLELGDFNSTQIPRRLLAYRQLLVNVWSKCLTVVSITPYHDSNLPAQISTRRYDCGSARLGPRLLFESDF